MQPIISIRNLSVYYSEVRVVSDVNLDVFKGETLAVVGESGAGKTTVANAIMRILPEIASVERSSSIIYNVMDNNYVDLLKLDEDTFSREIRWKEISMVFQSALNALNPTIRVYDHFAETARAHGIRDNDEIKKLSKELLELVGLDAERVLRMYPIELSGGMKQRVIIALALMLRPKFVILDEPTTALDVVTQRNILLLLKSLKIKYNLTYMLITHDLALVADIADRVAIMYAGRIMEIGNIFDIFYEPLHPYTRGLLQSIPKLGDFREPESIPGSTPDYRRLPPGCPFHPRCPYAMDMCRKIEPKPIYIGNRMVRCHLYEKSGR